MNTNYSAYRNRDNDLLVKVNNEFWLSKRVNETKWSIYHMGHKEITANFRFLYRYKTIFDKNEQRKIAEEAISYFSNYINKLSNNLIIQDIIE